MSGLRRSLFSAEKTVDIFSSCQQVINIAVSRYFTAASDNNNLHHFFKMASPESIFYWILSFKKDLPFLKTVLSRGCLIYFIDFPGKRKKVSGSRRGNRMLSRNLLIPLRFRGFWNALPWIPGLDAGPGCPGPLRACKQIFFFSVFRIPAIWLWKFCSLQNSGATE